MGAQSRWISTTTLPLEVSKFTWNTSGAFSFLTAGAAVSLFSFDDEQAASAKHAARNSEKLQSISHGNFQYAMLGEDMAAYDDFAWFYNRYWNEEFHGLAFPILERIWLPRVPLNGRILDVCCGTGYLAGLLFGAGLPRHRTRCFGTHDRVRPKERSGRRVPGCRRHPLPAARNLRCRRLDLRFAEPHPYRGRC